MMPMAKITGILKMKRVSSCCVQTLMTLRASLLCPHTLLPCNVETADHHGHAAPPYGYDLLSSLVSPALATQLPSDPAWPGSQRWEVPLQPSFGATPQIMEPIPSFQQPGFIQNMEHEDYIALGDGDETYEPHFDLDISQQPTAGVTNLPEKRVPLVDSQKKAAELRAKLLANRPRSAASGGSNTPKKKRDLPVQTKSKPQEPRRDGNHVQSSLLNLQSSTAPPAHDDAAAVKNGVRIHYTRLTLGTQKNLVIPILSVHDKITLYNLKREKADHTIDTGASLQRRWHER